MFEKHPRWIWCTASFGIIGVSSGGHGREWHDQSYILGLLLWGGIHRAWRPGRMREIRVQIEDGESDWEGPVMSLVLVNVYIFSIDSALLWMTPYISHRDKCDLIPLICLLRNKMWPLSSRLLVDSVLVLGAEGQEILGVSNWLWGMEFSAIGPLLGWWWVGNFTGFHLSFGIF